MPKKTEITIRSSAAEYLTFIAATGDNEQSFEMRYEDENIWLTQKMMAILYDISIQTIGQHIKNVLNDNELTREATIRKYLIVQNEGERQVKREVEHYSLQMIIAICIFQDKLFESDYDRFIAGLRRLEESAEVGNSKKP